MLQKTLVWVRSPKLTCQRHNNDALMLRNLTPRQRNQSSLF